MSRQPSKDLQKQQQQSLTINNFYFSKVQGKQTPQPTIKPQEAKLQYNKIHYNEGNEKQQKLNNFMPSNKGQPRYPIQNQYQLNQLMSNQKSIKNYSAVNTPHQTRNNFSPYIRNTNRSTQLTYNKNKITKSQNQSPIQQLQKNTIPGRESYSIQAPGSQPVKQQSYQAVSKSLNGSFDILQRRQKTINETQKPQTMEITPIKTVNHRAKSVADEYKLNKQPTPLKKRNTLVCRMDSETSFEGYRKAEKFLTMDSEDEKEVTDLLDEFTVKEFLRSKPMSKYMIEHFLQSLDQEQVQLVEKLVTHKKRENLQKKSTTQNISKRGLSQNRY